ncbi:UDP-N-acetylglucosamine 2-epimerase (non-hydrolyzing) [Paenibacillus sp. FSL L8-0323]|uniref:non-hydrolyzing UDP-N-acetylglucosamine 2-epimerase n=1 Tax=Paenibacillus TaxID=44249 RepID=UPI0004F84F9D|nr:UDP-N-acetylglucosamine 2-epimerase (non-hydrolyzing) [Paenibacillus odorifer]AIQ76839.1 UDP-N-acetylglucosamine 2-epimerase [Paenibacillus odorifer]OMD12283.1 UDP-N-acetylglucosamine 2-epimerase [Paenibacillus odorifer]OMD25631.1 UDP-N-acetylglucosamine 2-epimerase [Paenibacillus odorifer]
MKILTIIGARPQFIKAAPFSALFREENEEILVHTGQHYDANMSNVFFDELGIPIPNYYLGVGSGSHGLQTGRMLEKIEEIIKIEKPDGTLVYGDTNSTLAGALASSKLHIPVFHVEAGLRSYNKAMPEEQNRILTDHISKLLLCPTANAVENLKQEGIISDVFNTGDIMYDAVLRNIDMSINQYSNGIWLSEIHGENGMIPKLQENEYYLATIHRAENTDDCEKLAYIFAALREMDKPVIMPLHPRTRKMIEMQKITTHNVIIIEPVGYLLMLYLTAHAYMVLTDSGGLQKEAYFLKTPCVTLRNQTEWVETLENDWNVLSSIDSESILTAASRKLDCMNYTQTMLFGDGYAADRIYQAIVNGRIT